MKLNYNNVTLTKLLTCILFFITCYVIFENNLTSKPVSLSKTEPLLQVDANTGHKQAEESFHKQYVGNGRSSKQKSAFTPHNYNLRLHTKGLTIGSLNICHLLPKLDEIAK